MKRPLEDRARVVTLFQQGLDASTILKQWQGHKPCLDFIYGVIHKWKRHGTLDDLPRSGRPRTSRTAENRQRVRRNPTLFQRQIAKKTAIPRSSTRRIIVEDLGLKPYKYPKPCALTQAQKEKRIERCSRLLQRFEQPSCRRILFTDEKFFTLTPHYNRHNSRIYAPTFVAAVRELGQVKAFPPNQKLLVWAGISGCGKVELVFFDQATRLTADTYRELVLKTVVKSAAATVFGNSRWVFQQDGAPAHTAMTNQTWCRDVLRADHIGKDDWPPMSPDLNPCDYYLWGVLEQAVYARKPQTLAALRAAIVRTLDEVDLEEIRRACDRWRTRLELCVQEEGGRFEHLLRKGRGV